MFRLTAIATGGKIDPSDNLSSAKRTLVVFRPTRVGVEPTRDGIA